MDKYINANMVFSKFARGYMELEKDLPIRPSEMGVINIITSRQGDFTPLAIAELLGVSKPMIAAHLNVLERKGYIYKEVSLVDKRSFYVRPSEKGRLLAEEFKLKQTEKLKKIESEIGAEAFQSLVKTTENVNNILLNAKE